MIAKNSNPVSRSSPARTMFARALTVQRLLLALAMFCLVVGAVAPAFAQGTPEPINIDVGPLFAGINTYTPMFMEILSTPAGIMIAVTLVGLIIFLIVKAFQSARNSFGG